MKRYFIWFLVDLISTIPLFFLRVPSIHSWTRRHYIVLATINMLRLSHLRRMSGTFSRMERNWMFPYFIVRCLKLICVSLFTIHLAGCVNYFLASTYSHPSSTWIGTAIDDFSTRGVWTRYLISVYWSTTTLSTVGYGDLHPVNPTEMIFCIFFMLINLGLGTYLTGNMASLIHHEMSRTRVYRDTLRDFANFSQRNQLPNALQDQVHAHLCMKFTTQLQSVQQETLDALPKPLHSSVSYHLFSNLVNKIYLFYGVSDYIFFQLVSQMKVKYFQSREYIIMERDTPTDFYIVVNGVLDLLLDNGEREEVVGNAKEGDLCGEIGVICNKAHLLTVRAREQCQLLKVNRNIFLDIIRISPIDGSKIVGNFLNHLEHLTISAENPPLSSILRRSLVEAKSMISRGRIDMQVDLCFAASRGYNFLLRHLLEDGLDPNLLDNESDCYGRMALHIAADKGEVDCVSLLLEYGADPNLEDLNGKTAWELAHEKGHQAITAIIESNRSFIPRAE